MWNKALAQIISKREFILWTILQGNESGVATFHAETCNVSPVPIGLTSGTGNVCFKIYIVAHFLTSFETYTSIHMYPYICVHDKYVTPTG